MKAGPVLAMVLLILLGVWLVLQPTLERRERLDPNAERLGMTLGARDFMVERRPQAPGVFEFHTHGWPGVDELGWVGEEQFEDLISQELARWEERPAWERTLLGFFNITSWFTFSWIVVGLLGQCAFFGRMLVQWVVSERHGRSVVPAVFWWMSLLGGVLLFSYFVWRVDFIGVLGQSTGVVIYARNLRLIHKQKRRLQDAEARREAAKNARG